MIVPSMNSKELLIEISNDYPMVLRKAQYLADSMRRSANKSKNKYVHKVFEYKSKQNNDWLIIVDYYVANPVFSADVYYRDQYGINGIVLDIDRQVILHYTPHFLMRFNERVQRQANISKRDLLELFVSQNPAAGIQFVPDTDNEKNRIFSRFRQGIGLGHFEEVEDTKYSIYHYKTFISNDMVFKGQIEDFESAGKKYEIFWNEMYKFTRKGAFDL